MQLEATQQDLLSEYLRHFAVLIGDKRTGVTFNEIIKGIIGAGSLICERIAADSAVLTAVKNDGQRVIRFVKGESTKRSQLDADSLTAELRRRGVAQLSASEADEVWLILDGSDLRKPYAREMPNLMLVEDLNGKLVPGYRTLNVLGLTPERRAILYHRLFSSKEEDFLSESLRYRGLYARSARRCSPLKSAWR